MSKTTRKCGGVAAERGADGRFRPGNPGKSKGTRHRATRAVEALLDGEAEALTRKAVDMALAGDTTALKLCIDRIAPRCREAPVVFKAPEMATAADAAKAMGEVLRAVAAGELTPAQGTAIAGLVEAFRRTLELGEIEARLTALEERNGR